MCGNKFRSYFLSKYVDNELEYLIIKDFKNFYEMVKDTLNYIKECNIDNKNFFLVVDLLNKKRRKIILL